MFRYSKIWCAYTHVYVLRLHNKVYMCMYCTCDVYIGIPRNKTGLPNLTTQGHCIYCNYDIIFCFLDKATARCSEVVFLASLFHKSESVDFVLQNILFKPYILKLNGAEEGFWVPCWRPALRLCMNLSPIGLCTKILRLY